MEKDFPERPRWQAQHCAHQASADWPFLGRDALDHGHAVFAIVGHLGTLGLQAWTSRLLQWLARYDGFERYVEEDAHDPLLCVRDLLLGYVIGQGRALAAGADAGVGEAASARLRQCIVGDILQLDFVRYRAFWGPEPVPRRGARHWQPLKQTWLSFIESRQAGESLWVWLSPREPMPSLAALRAHLLGA